VLHREHDNSTDDNLGCNIILAHDGGAILWFIIIYHFWNYYCTLGSGSFTITTSGDPFVVEFGLSLSFCAFFSLLFTAHWYSGTTPVNAEQEQSYEHYIQEPLFYYITLRNVSADFGSVQLLGSKYALIQRYLFLDLAPNVNTEQRRRDIKEW
jgi:hypothetical protein